MHFRVFEFWRLSAALLIMSWHFLRFAPPGHEAVSAALYRLMPLMEMFFMISGFLIMLRYVDKLGTEPGAYRRFIIRRLARFYPLYLATLAFFTLIAVGVQWGWLHSDSPDRYAPGAFLPNLLLLQAWGLTDTLTYNYVAWSMSAEWFCYLLLPIIVLTFRRFSLPGLMVLSLACIAALELATAWRIIPFDSWLEANTWGAYRAFADFALGALVAMAVRDSRWRMTSHWPGWIAFALAITAMATQQGSYFIVLMLAVAMYLAALAERNNPAGSAWLQPTQPIGQVSLGIYLIHPVIEALFFSILWRKLVEPLGIVSYYVYWLVPMAVVVAVSLLSARYFEKPMADYINTRLVKRRGGQAALARQPAE